MIRALLVDDEAAFLKLAVMFLEEQEDILCDTARSATEALIRLQETPCDVVISDYEMPGLDGIAFLKQVRERFGSIPFILFTGKGREEIVIEALNNGADFYLQKGLDPEAQFTELVHKVRHAVGKKLAETQLAESEMRYRLLFDKIHAAIDIMEIIRDDVGKPIEFRYLDINASSEEIAGMTKEELIGKNPMNRYTAFNGHWQRLLNEVACTGETKRCELFSPVLNRHFDVTMYRTQYNRLTAITYDITKWADNSDINR